MFITVEGIDGSGKTTQIELLLKYFLEKNIDCLVTREPGGIEVSEKIRDILLDKNLKMENITELFLIIAARSEHYKKIIFPALKQKKVVICDRFIDSTIAYQGYARQLELTTIDFLNKIATQNVKPDMTLFFDLEPEIALKRLKKYHFDRFEKEGIDFQRKVRNGYLEIAKNEKNRVKVIEIADLNIAEIHKKVLEIVEESLHIFLNSDKSN